MMEWLRQSFEAPNLCLLTRSVTLQISDDLGWTLPERFKNCYDEHTFVDLRYTHLLSNLPLLRNVRTISIYSEHSRFMRVAILEKISRLPSIEALELNYQPEDPGPFGGIRRGRCLVDDDDARICPTIKELIPRLKHLRLRCKRLCHELIPPNAPTLQTLTLNLIPGDSAGKSTESRIEALVTKFSESIESGSFPSLEKFGMKSLLRIGDSAGPSTSPEWLEVDAIIDRDMLLNTTQVLPIEDVDAKLTEEETRTWIRKPSNARHGFHDFYTPVWEDICDCVDESWKWAFPQGSRLPAYSTTTSDASGYEWDDRPLLLMPVPMSWHEFNSSIRERLFKWESLADRPLLLPRKFDGLARINQVCREEPQEEADGAWDLVKDPEEDLSHDNEFAFGEEDPEMRRWR